MKSSSFIYTFVIGIWVVSPLILNCKIGGCRLRTFPNGDVLEHLPKYFRIQQELLNHIRQRLWPPGSAIPSEAELCQQYRASRGTVRRALDALEQQGLILRLPGKGTVVCAPKIPLLAAGFRADIAKKGLRPGTRVLAIKREPVSWEIAQLLEVAMDSLVVSIHRIIYADDSPLILESAYARMPLDPIADEEVQNTSLLELIPQKSGAFLSRAVESYEPIVVTDEQATLLECPRGALGIRDQAVLFDGDGQPLYVSTAIVDGAKARIVTEETFRV